VSTRFPSPGLSIARCRWKLTGHVGPDGAPLPQRKGVLMNVLLHQGDGKWLIVDSQNTDIIEDVMSRPQS